MAFGLIHPKIDFLSASQYHAVVFILSRPGFGFGSFHGER